MSGNSPLCLCTTTPVKKFTYSEGLDVLGQFIEVISGQPFDVFLQTHTFWASGDEGHRLLPSGVQDGSPREGLGSPPMGNGCDIRSFYDPDLSDSGRKDVLFRRCGSLQHRPGLPTFLQMGLNGANSAVCDSSAGPPWNQILSGQVPVDLWGNPR